MKSSTTSPRAADGRNLVATTLLCVSSFLAPLAVHSQPLSGDGYLFQPPRVIFAIRGGYSQAEANGDVLQHARRNLTLDRSDFGALQGGADIGIRIVPRLWALASFSYASRSVDSEMRDWVDSDLQPIEQNSQLMRMPLTLGLRFDLLSPGRSVGKLAFIPSLFVPYVSAGAGGMWYKFKQVGSFKDDNSDAIFDNTLETDGSTTVKYGAIGTDIRLRPTLSLNTEVRYESAFGRPNQYESFGGFDRLDLSGITATIGFSFRY